MAESFTLNASATPGHATFDRAAAPGPGPFNIDITASERLDMNLNGGDDAFASNGAIAALGLHVDVEGADGNDVSDVNGAPVAESFTIKPSPTAGRVLFDRLATPGPGAFNVDIGTTESLRLNAGGGDDRIRGHKGLAGLIVSTLNGDDGNDRIRGTDGADAVAGGTGNDLIVARDKAADAVECGAGLDLGLPTSSTRCAVAISCWAGCCASACWARSRSRETPPCCGAQRARPAACWPARATACA